MGFETIVRPVVVPNIRPQPWQTRAPTTVVAAARARRIHRAIPHTITDPPEGSAVIHGNPAKQINLTTSTSVSISRSVMQEKQRRTDEVRIFQRNSDGTINRDNFIDVDSTNRMWLDDYSGRQRRHYSRVPTGDITVDSVVVRKRDKIYNATTDGYLEKISDGTPTGNLTP